MDGGKIAENRRAVGMLNPLRDVNEAISILGVEKEETSVTKACSEGWKIKLMDKKGGTIDNTEGKQTHPSPLGRISKTVFSTSWESEEKIKIKKNAV